VALTTKTLLWIIVIKQWYIFHVCMLWHIYCGVYNNLKAGGDDNFKIFCRTKKQKLLPTNKFPKTTIIKKSKKFLQNKNKRNIEKIVTYDNYNYRKCT